MTYKKYNNDSYNLYTIKTDKFKTCQMEIVFYRKLNKEKITIENVLSDILVHSSLKYPKRKYVVEHLEDLYNANFYSTTSRVGNIRTINFIYNFIDPIYADKSYLKDVISFPFEMLFNPNIKNDEFDERSLKIIKSRVYADIKSIKENPTRYALKKSLYLTSKDMPSSYELVGNIKDLNKINSSNLFSFYNELFEEYYCDIYLIGNLDMDKVNIMIKNLFKNDIIKTEQLNPYYYLKNNNNKTIEYSEKDNLNQSTLVCIYNLDNLSSFEQNYVFYIFNTIYGSGSLTNKLSKNLREDNSLCYNVSSLYQKYDNLLIVYTGIDAKNKRKALNLIKKSLKEMINSKFNEDDVDNAIKYNINILKSSLDNQDSIIDNYFFNIISNSPLINERVEVIDSVTKKDISNLAKKIKLKTIFFLEANNEGN
ncbi:MAG: insulinase family protein [Bacilli bacterium]|nr:insulinase family protein [Bacilli bacterium]